MELRRTENALLGLIWAGLGLLLLVPFVVTKQTIFPFVVGKALYARSLIEVVFLAWAVLAFLKPAYRPPRSWLLILLGANVVIAVVSACLGVSVQRSFWSTYERMQGVVDQVHWFALALVLVSVVRATGWRVLLQVHLVLGLGISLWAVAQYFDIGVWKESAVGYLRITTTLGNPIFVGGFAVVNCLLAAGFFVQTWFGERGDAGPLARCQPWLARLSWGGIALLNLWVVTLAGARGPFLGLLAGATAVGFLYVWGARGRTRLIAGGIAAVFAVAAVALVARVSVDFDRSGEQARFSNPLLDRLTHFSKTNVETRLSAWDAGWEGFAEEPFIGWGPENFVVVFGRHVDPGVGADMLVHDDAHNKVVEELATEGALGLIGHVALWAAILAGLLRVARTVDPRHRTMLLFAGGALVGQFVHTLTAVGSADVELLFTLLLAFLATSPGDRSGDAGRSSKGSTFARIGGLVPLFSHPTVRTGSGVACLVALTGVVGAGLYANQAAYSAARSANYGVTSSLTRFDPDETRWYYDLAIAEFGPLANQPRMLLFQYVGQMWRSLRMRDPTALARLMDMVDAEAAEAVRIEPENWELHAMLAQLYANAGTTDARYRETAARYVESARRLAPNRRETIRLPSLLREPPGGDAEDEGVSADSPGGT